MTARRSTIKINPVDPVNPVKMKFSKTVLDIDSEKEIFRVSEFIRDATFKKFRRRGAVVGLSGGVDSAVVAEFLVQALGKERGLGLLLPEKESTPISTEYGLKQAKKLTW